jgi:hypothetical protein
MIFFSFSNVIYAVPCIALYCDISALYLDLGTRNIFIFTNKCIYKLIISCAANPGMVYITYETEHSGGSSASGQSIERDLINILP